MSLRVTGIRSDSFHLIDAEMVTLALADKLEIDPNSDGIELIGKFVGGLSTSEDNLVARALKLVNRRAGVVITKNIPSGGGLGGGSADAAAILRWAGFTDLIAAGELGADIPFCIVGGRARVRGIGEIIEPLPNMRREITLVIPPFTVSTPAVYQAFDKLTQFGKVPIKNLGSNDLEAAAIYIEPRLAIWKQKITQVAGAEPMLAGSGSTWWLDGKFESLASQLPEATVLVTHTK